MQPQILAIETSCDETSAAIIRNGKVLNNVVASQTVHQNYGGVVPELASRAHQKKILPVVSEALSSAGIASAGLDAIAVTVGPGLMGSLLVGSSFAKGMALALQIPLIEVNHMEAHVLAHFIHDQEQELPQSQRRPQFPFLCLTVSGGHTQILVVKDYLSMKVIGETRDDAAGEAFDKAAKIMGLPYPGGPLIDQHAKRGDPERFAFPVTVMPGLDFSFSGIKTAFLYLVRDGKAADPGFVERYRDDLCASLQSHLVEMLLVKLEAASRQTGITEVAISGGVAANTLFRVKLSERARLLGWSTFIPPIQYCTDNAAMVAIAAHYKFLAGRFSDLHAAPTANLEIA